MMKLQSASKLPRRVATLRPVVLALISAGCVSVAAQGLPQGMTLKAGQADIATNASGNTMTATQTSSRAVWEASNFSIAAGNAFVNTGPTGSLTMVRVVGNGFGQRSDINGTLQANNTFMLVNPFGIYVGGTAVVQAANLLLSAKDVSPDLVGQDGSYAGFMSNGHLVFNTNANNGYGDSTIDISPGAKLTAMGKDGSIYLVADNVRNRGAIIAANAGKVGLLAVPSAEFDVQANVGDSGFITLTSYAGYNGQDLTNRVATNSDTGTIYAPNGTVIMAGVGGSSQNNRFDDIDGQSMDGTVITPLYRSGVNGSYGSGAFNSGTITAQGSNGGKGSVKLIAQGPGSIAAVTGKIDASALDAASIAGAISMSGETVRVGLYGDAGGQLLVDGPSGGGTIDLGDTALEKGDATPTKWIYVSGNSGTVFSNSDNPDAPPVPVDNASILSASATDNGKGGTITLRAMYADQTNVEGTPQARYEFGQIEAYGNFIAQGGPHSTAGNGAGGKVQITGQQVNLSYNGMKARFLVAPLTLHEANGSVSVMTPYVNIGYDGRGYGEGYGGHYEPSFGESWIDPDVITETLQGGADMSVTASGDGYNTLFGDSYMYGAWGVQIGSSGAGARTLSLKSDNDITFSGNTSITAFAGEGDSGPLNIEMEANNGGVFLYGQGGSEPAPVNITTNGGNVTLNGVTSTFFEGPSAGVYISGGNIDTRGATGQGLLTINGTADAQTGVQIENDSKLTGNHVLIKGVSLTGTGVALSDTTIAGAAGIEVYGASLQVPVNAASERRFLSAAAVPQAAGQAPIQVSTGPAGVDIGSNVVFNAGQGNITILGRSASGDGVRIKDLTLTSTVMADVRQRFTIAGESADGGMGVNVLAGGTGIQVHDESGAGLASTADVVIGGTSSGNQGQSDMELGNPLWNTTGSVNFRPLSVNVDEQGSFSMAENLARPIYVGTPANGQTGFVVAPNAFNAGANDGIGSTVSMVIGSSGHNGKITVADGALDGAGIVTLQNQGANSAGIQLGAQTAPVQTLNLVTNGDITQTGPIKVGGLRIISGVSSKVVLNSILNEINTVSYNNQPPDVAPQGVASAVPLANGSAAGIVSYNSQTGQFQYLEITNRGNTSSLPEIPRPFEGPDALDDLRTDVYVHGQLSRPQICTAANTSAGAAGPDGGAEPLALEWVKVRRSAQLSSCSGVKTDNSCSAF